MDKHAEAIAVRTIYQFTCGRCLAVQVSRHPFNPLSETPDIFQEIPQGWTLTFSGDNPQTPVAECGECLKK